jgi:hypothetical protein
MAIYPNGRFRPVTRFKPGGSLDRESRGQRRVVLHTAVSNQSSLFQDMNVPNTPTSHFYVDREGTVEQYVDTDICSTANLEGNHDCITIESWDGFGELWHEGDPVPEWNDDQVAGLIELVAWVCETHDIPAQQLASSRPGTRGIGWHRQGINGNFPRGLLAGRVKDGEQWSLAGGKSCPGDARIRQVGRRIIPGLVEAHADSARVAGIAGIARVAGAAEEVPTQPRVSLRNVQQQAQALRPLPGVRQIQNALNTELALSLEVNGLFDPATKDAYRAWQREQGFTGDDADGVPGSRTLAKLGENRFTVVDDD